MQCPSESNLTSSVGVADADFRNSDVVDIFTVLPQIQEDGT